MIDVGGKAGELGKEIDTLPAAADEATRERLSVSLAPVDTEGPVRLRQA